MDRSRQVPSPFETCQDDPGVVVVTRSVFPVAVEVAGVEKGQSEPLVVVMTAGARE